MATRKVYIVTSGSYSDYRINEVFASRELAEEYIAVYMKNGELVSEVLRIEEFDLRDDPMDVAEIRYVEVMADINEDREVKLYSKVHFATALERTDRLPGYFWSGASWARAPLIYRSPVPTEVPDDKINEYVCRAEKAARDMLFLVEYWRTYEKLSPEEIRARLKGRTEY
jgi:hypothetical protein